MHASVGDRLVIPGHKVGEAIREGEVRAVLGEQGSPPYLVRWSDGHEGVFFPSSDANVVPAGAHASA